MLRARRALAAAASGSQPPLRLVRRLQQASRGNDFSARLLTASSSASRFAVGGTRGFMTRNLVPHTMQAMQLRWRSTLSDAQVDQLMQHMDALTACRDNGTWRQALKLLDRIDKEGFALDPEMYELAMAACARMGKIDVLPGLLQNMAIDSLLPTHRTVDVVMQAYIAAEEWELIVGFAKDVSAKGVPLSDAAFQAAFESCGMLRDAASARQILLNVEAAKSMALDTSHFAAAIRACGMGGRADLAAGLFAHMEEKSGLAADADVFNQLIRSQIVNNELPQALQTFSTVNERPDIELNESIYTATIDALVTAGEFWQASQLFSQMMTNDMSPSVFCYGRMMVAYVRLNKHELARECWTRVLDINEQPPSLVKYARMATALATTNDSELVATIFEHVFPHHDPAYIRDTTYAAAIRAYGRLGLTQTAVDLFDTFVASRRRVGKPLPRSAGIYLAVFNALSRDTDRDPSHNSRDAQRVWEIMVDSVPVVLAPAYASLAGVLASSGDHSTLEQLMEHAQASMNDMGTRNMRSTRRSRDYYAPRKTSGAYAADPFESLADDDEYDETESASAAVVGETHWQDELLFNGVISGFSKARSDQSHRVMEYLETMRARGMAITDSVVRASTDTFVKHAQWDAMVALLDFVDVRNLQNADLCYGDTISKLLEAQAWGPARAWIARAHRLPDVQPPIRGKMEVLAALRKAKSHEWQIAYALARETLSFKKMVQENVDSVADAIEVCFNAGRFDLAFKLFERTVNHVSVEKAFHDMKVPLRMYKKTLRACMREHALGGVMNSSMDAPLEKAEAICAHMLQTYAIGKRDGVDVETLDGDALSLAISIKATMGDDDDVLALFEKMQQHGLEPNSYAYNAAITAYSRASQVDRVLAIRDELYGSPHLREVLARPELTQSLLFSLAIIPDDELQREQIAATRAMLPHVTSTQIVRTCLQAKRLANCIEYLDEHVPHEVFAAVLRRLLDGPPLPKHSDQPVHWTDRNEEIRLTAPLLLKYVAFHGLDSVKPPALTVRVAQQLVAHGHLREARAILELFETSMNELSLSDLTPACQRDALEMLLYINGEEKHYDKLCELFDKAKPSAVPLHVRHYQLAMEYCVLPAESKYKRDREAVAHGARSCLKLFEAMRMQFVKPNGAVYVLALQSCQRLGRLDVTGARVVGDAVDQGFGFNVATELFRLAKLAVLERSPAHDHEAGDKQSWRGRRKDTPVQQYQVDAAELATLALFCHHRGVPISWRLATRLLELGSALPKNARNELEYIAEAHNAVHAAKQRHHPETTTVSPTATTTSRQASTSENAARVVRAATPARGSPTTKYGKATSKPGARWGELYRPKMP